MTSDTPNAAKPLEPWRVTASRMAYEDRWIRVRADDCVTSEGVEIAPFYVLQYPEWVHVVAIDTEGKLLFVEQYRHGIARMSIELPGGVMDRKDADPVETAKRELMEETGYVARDWQPIGKLSPNPATHTNYVHFVLARGAEFSAAPADDPTERVRLHRYTVAETMAHIRSGAIYHGAHIGGLMLALQTGSVQPG